MPASDRSAALRSAEEWKAPLTWSTRPETSADLALPPTYQASGSRGPAWTGSKKMMRAASARNVPVIFALPAILSLGLLLAYPLLYTVALALTHSTLGRPFMALSELANFREALQSQAFTGSLVRTTVFAVAAALLEVGLGLAVALVLHARGSRFGIIGTVLLLPMLTPPIMVGVAWQLLLAPAGGGLTGLWRVLGIPGFNAFETGTSAFIALLLIEVWQWVPFVVLLVYVALLGVDKEQIEAAMIDGANLWRRFIAVIYPAIAPVVLSVLLLRLLGGFKAFDVAYVITQGGPGFSTTFTTYQVFRTVLDGAYDTGLGAAETLLFGVVIGITTIVVTAARKRAVKAEV
jgi:multiple sugar transport system permease protein